MTDIEDRSNTNSKSNVFSCKTWYEKLEGILVFVVFYDFMANGLNLALCLFPFYLLQQFGKRCFRWLVGSTKTPHRDCVYCSPLRNNSKNTAQSGSQHIFPVDVILETHFRLIFAKNRCSSGFHSVLMERTKVDLLLRMCQLHADFTQKH